MLTKRDIGLNIQNKRKKAGLRQEDLARLLGTGKGQISRIERGNGNYGVDWLFDIARILKCQVDDFCNGQKAPRPLHEILRTVADIIEKGDYDKTN